MKDFDYGNIHSGNPLHFIIGEVDGYIEEKNENKYLIFASRDKNKEVLSKYTELWNKINDLIKASDSNLDEYGNDFVKIEFNSNKIPKLHNLTITVRSVFQEDNKYCP